MKRIEFNRTGLTVTRIGLGLAALGRPGYINLGHGDDLNHQYDASLMESQAHSVLDFAWDRGIRYFDAARSYGRAEFFLSTWLHSRQINPIEVVVGSKWGYTYTAEWKVVAQKHEVKDLTLPVLHTQYAESRELLAPYLKLYQIHSATLESGVLDDKAVLNQLAGYRDNGMVIGLSLSGAQQADTLRKALTINFGGAPLFGSVQATWNLFAQEAGEALQIAHDSGMGVIIKEALANGRLTTRNNEPRFAEKRRLLDQLAMKNNVTIDALALAAAINQPWSDIVLSGAARKEHLESNIQALDIVWDEETRERLTALAEPAEVYWAERSRLKWN